MLIAPAVEPVSVVEISANVSLASSHINATLVRAPRSITIPMSKVFDPLALLLRTIKGSETTVLVVSTVVVVPLTVKLPVILKLPV